MLQPRLRDGYQKKEPYPLNQIPTSTVEGICSYFVYFLATGREKLSGDDWSWIFAQVIQGRDFASPLGVADVDWEDCCWSQKTIKSTKPHDATSVRLIVGRNSPAYSFDINDPKANIQETGDAVLSIYNQRIDQARSTYRDTRLGVLIRNMDTLEYCYFERALTPFSINDFEWRLNKNRNLEGFVGDQHRFTWQPHGSQFTMLEEVPASAARFRLIKRPPSLSMASVLTDVDYHPGWVEHQ